MPARQVRQSDAVMSAGTAPCQASMHAGPRAARVMAAAGPGLGKRMVEIGRENSSLSFLYFYSETEMETEKFRRENEISNSIDRKWYNSIGNMSVTVGNRYLEAEITIM